MVCPLRGRVTHQIFHMIANDIHEVIAHLDTIVADAKANRDVLGYFAAMYRAVTRSIRDDIVGGQFEDGPRMDRLDTGFANYYLRAYTSLQGGETPSDPWLATFDFARRSEKGVFQHLLLAMNAHINFDLAQAVVEDPAVAADLPALNADYQHINDLLLALLDPLQNVVEPHISGARGIDILLGRLDERFAGWEITEARAHAWRHANQLASAPSTGDRAVIVDHMDHFTTQLARRLLTPKCGATAAAWWLARRLEDTDVVAIIESIETIG